MPETIKEILCTPENAREFNAALREALPGAHDLARALHKAGLIDGLRGARIRPVGAENHAALVAVRPALSAASESRRLDREWAAGTWKDDQSDIRAANHEWMRRGERIAADKAGR